MTEQWRMSVAIPKQLEERILELRKTEKFCRMTFSELIRYLLSEGIKSEHGADNNTVA